MSIYDSLNTEQRKAVEHDKGPLLLLAGAGSGKTRVLTHRIAYLIEERAVNPYHIMALTFTNKAAKEMRERVDQIVDYGAENIWVSTFHSTCVRILRRFIESLGYGQRFTIYDTDDQKTLMREICKSLQVDTKKTKERVFLSAISSAKDKLITPEEYLLRAQGDYSKTKIAQVYQEYQKRLKQNNSLDFDDLLFKTVELFQNNKEALNFYQRRFRYIMVDEYQDTNTAQFELVRLLASYTNEFGEVEHNLCVVGDDDQSIYKFRGANIRNIIDFEGEYPDTTVIKLEQNYRSTQNILNAANAVIHHNLGRKDKTLWTNNEEGKPISFQMFENDYEEANAVTHSIMEHVAQGLAKYKDCAILYRTNAQSRALEEKLVRQSIPYKLIGGINFYARKEIKDLLAYLKTIENGVDSIAVRRIINVPKRGIGLTTIDRIEEYANQNNISFYQALRHAKDMNGLARAAEKISSFVSLIESLRSKLKKHDCSLEELIKELIEATGYQKELEALEEDEALDRIQNVNELVNKIAEFENNADEPPTLGDFLEEIALVSDLDHLSEDADAVVLMTLHSAKGLEFPFVYLCGMEEGLFPSYLSINADNPELEIEEERRLCYVGFTRAKKELALSAAKIRMVHGEYQYHTQSRFVNEIPRYLLTFAPSGSRSLLARNEDSYTNPLLHNSKSADNTAISKSADNTVINKASWFDNSNTTSKVNTSKPYAATVTKQFGNSLGPLAYCVGDTVKHAKFGVGKVTMLTKGGRDYEVTVDFGAKGIKKMLSSFANLIPLKEE